MGGISGRLGWGRGGVSGVVWCGWHSTTGLTILPDRRPNPLGAQPGNIIIQTLDPLQKGLPAGHQHHPQADHVNVRRTVFPACQTTIISCPTAKTERNGDSRCPAR